MNGDKRSLLSIRPTRARRPFDASVDPTEARTSAVLGTPGQRWVRSRRPCWCALEQAEKGPSGSGHGDRVQVTRALPAGAAIRRPRRHGPGAVQFLGLQEELPCLDDRRGAPVGPSPKYQRIDGLARGEGVTRPFYNGGVLQSSPRVLES